MKLLNDPDASKVVLDEGLNPVEHIFESTELIRDRTVQSSLTASNARIHASEQDLADLMRREQDAKKQIYSIQLVLGQALSKPLLNQDLEHIASLKQDIEKLRLARSTLWEEIDRRFPKYNGLMNPRPTKLSEVQSRLLPNESLISIYVGNKHSYVWAIPNQGEISFQQISLGKKRVNAFVNRLRRVLAPNAKTLGDIPKFDFNASYELYRVFLHPVRKGWMDSSQLIIVANGSLGYLPFSLLTKEPFKLKKPSGVLFSDYNNAPWLIRNHAFTVVPSVTALASLRTFESKDIEQKPFVGFEDPIFNLRNSAQYQSFQIVALDQRGVISIIK